MSASAVVHVDERPQGLELGGPGELPPPQQLGGYSRYLQAPERVGASDWLASMFGLSHSEVLRHIWHPLLSMTGAAVFASVAHCRFKCPGLPSLSAHTLLGSGLSLLLVFRTNSAYERFQEGRHIWNDIMDLCRDISRSVALFKDAVGPEKLASIQASLQAFPFAMQEHVHAGASAAMHDRLERLLGQAGTAGWWRPRGTRHARQSAAATGRNEPLELIAQLLRTIGSIEGRGSAFTSRERLWLLGMVAELSHTIGRCERLVQTPVPRLYARHTLCFLAVWMLTLPWALVDSLRWLTAPATFVITWALFGLIEIGGSIEQPFAQSIELSPICEAIHHDCNWALHFDEI